MTLEEMRELRKLLQKRAEDFSSKKDDRVKALLDNPEDNNIQRQLHFIHEYEKQISAAYELSLEVKFDIEDITGEEEIL